jgi:hypothetical protein
MPEILRRRPEKGSRVFLQSSYYSFNSNQCASFSVHLTRNNRLAYSRFAPLSWNDAIDDVMLHLDVYVTFR